MSSYFPSEANWEELRAGRKAETSTPQGEGAKAGMQLAGVVWGWFYRLIEVSDPDWPFYPSEPWFAHLPNGVSSIFVYNQNQLLFSGSTQQEL